MTSINTSPSAVSDQVTPVLRTIERAIRHICHIISEQAVNAFLKTVLLFVALFALKENLKDAFGYECPRKGYFFYGSLYIFGPAVFFLCIAFVVSRPFWDFVTGCFRLSCKRRLLASPNSATDIYLAISAPFLWVAIGLSEASYYICALYGPVHIVEVWEEHMDPKIRWHHDTKARCHILCWGIIMSWAIISAVMVSIYRCCNRDHEAGKQEKTISTYSNI